MEDHLPAGGDMGTEVNGKWGGMGINKQIGFNRLIGLNAGKL